MILNKCYLSKWSSFLISNVSLISGLEESRDELQAAAALQAGRELLMLNPCNNNAEKGPSLAVELLAGMNPDQVVI